MPDEPKSQGPTGVEADPKSGEATAGEASSEPEEPTSEETGLETQVDMEELGPCKRKLAVAVPAEKVLEEIEKSYRELGGNLAFPGFRKGHVPRAILEKRFGAQIQDEVKESLMASSFEEALSQKSLSPLGEPKFDKIEFEREKPFSFEVTLDVRPQFELGTYKGIQVQEPSTEPSQEDVEATIQRVLQSRAELVTAEDGVAREGDYLIADVGLFVGEEKIRLEEEVSVPVGVDQIFGVKDAGIKDLLIGAKVDTPSELEVQLDDSFPAGEHRGKKARITVAPKEVKRARLPELDAALADELGFKSVADFKDDVTGKLRARKELEKNSHVERDILDKIVAGLDLPLPDDVLKSEAENVEARQRWRLRQIGIGEKEIDESIEESRSKSLEEIARNLREIFVLDKIADAEKTYVTEDEVDRHLTAIAPEYGKPMATLKEELRDAGRLSVIRAEMRHVKVRAFLRENAEILPAASGRPEKKAAPEKKGEAKKAAPKKAGKAKKTAPAKKPGTKEATKGAKGGKKG